MEAAIISSGEWVRGIGIGEEAGLRTWTERLLGRESGVTGLERFGMRIRGRDAGEGDSTGKGKGLNVNVCLLLAEITVVGPRGKAEVEAAEDAELEPPGSALAKAVATRF